MEFIDVVFPLNLKHLTYKCPDILSGKAHPGMLVLAPLKTRTARGIILGKSSPAERYNMHAARYISDILGDSPLFEPPLLKLLEWMSDYYIANKGIILKNMLPKEAFKKIRARKSGASSPAHPSLARGGQAVGGSSGTGGAIDENMLLKINESVAKKEYKTFLLYAPSSLHETLFASRLVHPQQNTIILVPEIVNVSTIEPFVRESAGDRLCILHSGLSGSQRSDSYEKIMSGQCSVVLGTRMAVFASLKNVSLIVVMQEHSDSYRTEEGLRYNARDIAVMRGYLEKSTVVLSSICPSVESVYNTNQNKYMLLKPDMPVQRPKVRIINMHNEKKPGQNLSKPVIDAAQSLIKRKEKVMFVLNRKGYSMLTCRECGYTETCEKCNIPLIFHKENSSLVCHYCSSKSPLPEKCRKCRSFELELSGSGIQRIEEDIKRIFNLDPVRLDSDKIKKKTRQEDLSELIKDEAIVLGTRLLTRRIHCPENFGMAAVLNADANLNLPDFRAAEKAYQEITAIAGKVTSGGKVFLQTKMPQNYLFKYIRNYDYAGFCEEELERRRTALYPPYTKLAIMTFTGKNYDDEKLSSAVAKVCAEEKDLEILGPSPSLNKKGRKEFALLLKTTSRKRLHHAIKEFLKVFEEDKNLTVNIIIDP